MFHEFRPRHVIMGGVPRHGDWAARASAEPGSNEGGTCCVLTEIALGILDELLSCALTSDQSALYGQQWK